MSDRGMRRGDTYRVPGSLFRTVPTESTEKYNFNRAGGAKRTLMSPWTA
jgi:hypothetical protein